MTGPAESRPPSCRTKRAASSLDVLSSFWGFHSFRHGQEEIIESVVGGLDTLALLPTGGGKSHCFQIPGLLRGGVTLVLSPLISLMHDQVLGLAGRGIAAFAMTGRVDAALLSNVRRRMSSTNSFFLYLSPERLHTRQFQWLIQGQRVGLIVVDEAHCISPWGHDFRPAYRSIQELRANYGAPFCALTATATRRVERDIVRSLALRSPRVFRYSFDRPNIHFSVLHVIDARGEVLDWLERERGPAIIYDSSREGVEIWAEKLRRAGISSAGYHGGLNAGFKDHVQRRWMRKKVRVMVATNAFGMGIDRPDVRLVLHVGLPDSLESYYQEAGRAGRDGRPAHAVLLVSPEARKARMALLKAGSLLQRRRANRLVRPLLRYAQREMCRRWGVLGYFGESIRIPCGNCDVCGHLKQRASHH